MSDSTHPAGGVFLSYAREDACAARRIAEAMRAFGVEGWFDGTVAPNDMRINPPWSRLKDDPRFEEILKPVQLR